MFEKQLIGWLFIPFEPEFLSLALCVAEGIDIQLNTGKYKEAQEADIRSQCRVTAHDHEKVHLQVNWWLNKTMRVFLSEFMSFSKYFQLDGLLPSLQAYETTVQGY